MTHTLHRYGTAENLQNDYVVFAIAAQTVNAKGKAPVFAEFFKIIEKYDHVFCGDMKTGNEYAVGLDAIREGFRDNSIVHAVFTNPDEVAKVLKELAQADLGLSIVVSGIVDHVDECCGKAGIKRHTVERSLGIHGNTKRLPQEEVLEISTMCGHGMVAFNLILHLLEEMKASRITADDAAKEMASQCHCGVVNPVRAMELLKEMAKGA
ncbi:MAG: hypothetical protein ACOY35_01810 [Bacillota bacterium]|nr:hypothetical protein [Gammaproteobacteria bacterium]